MFKDRYLTAPITEDLGKKMVFVGGPRQVGKTTLNLRYFRDRLKIPFAYQAIKKEGVDRINNGIRVISADKLFSALV